jgi:hypothetical protein
MTPREIAEWVCENAPAPLDDVSAPEVCQAYLDLLAKCERFEAAMKLYGRERDENRRLREFLVEVLNTDGDPKFLVEHLKERAREALKDGEG